MHRERVLKALAGLLVGVEKKLHLADRRRRREDKLIERARLLEMQRAQNKTNLKDADANGKISYRIGAYMQMKKLEEEAIITEDFKDLTNNDMHIIEAVGLEGGNMSSIAAKLDITVGSLTTSMNSLVKKGYTERERSEKDRRIVYIHLTGKGRQAFHHHAKFHEQMTDAVMAELGEEEVQVLGKTLKALTDFFRSYKK